MKNSPYPLITYQNAKTVKGEPHGWRTGVLFLAPHRTIHGYNLCPRASAGCSKACIFTAGMGHFTYVQQARIRRTREYLSNPGRFYLRLQFEIQEAQRDAARKGFRLALRLNATSDQPELARRMARLFPSVQLYDYTKLERPWLRTLPNYHITFSRSEDNWDACLKALDHGINVAVVFSRTKSQPLPKTWEGYRVVDGDANDLRFLDPAGVIVGLRSKGRGRYDETGFVVQIPPPEPGEVLEKPPFENPYKKLRYRKPKHLRRAA